MMLSLASLPLWASGVLLVGVMTAVFMAASWATRRNMGLERLAINNEVAGFKFAIVGVIYAVLLGFAVIIVWEKFRDAETSVSQEAAAASSMYRLASGLAPAERQVTRNAISFYLRTTIDKDWPAMERGRSSPEAQEALTRLYADVLTSEPANARESAVLQQMLAELSHLTESRRERISLSAGVVPGVVWMVLFLGAFDTLAFTFFFGTANIRAQVLMTGMLALIIFLSLYVILNVDRPFTGPVHVTAEPLQRTLDDSGG